MSFLTPLSLLLGLLGIPIVVLYMLRLRRREVLVSSTLLWRMALRDKEANRPWQRLRRNLLLLLQLLLLALLVLALARPFLPVPVVAAGQVTVLLDGSASMQATDVQPSRFAIAQAAAAELVEGLASDGVMTVILVGNQPAVLISTATDKTRLRAAIAAATPSAGIADWESAVALAGGAARNAAGANAATVVISDGGLPAGLQTLPGDVRFIPIGASAANLGVSALSIRSSEFGQQLYASVTNYGDADSQTILSITTDGALLDARRLDVPAGETVGVNLELANAARLVEARIAPPAGAPATDNLTLDDRAWSVFDATTAGRVLFISEIGNLFIEQVLAVLPGIRPFRLPADQPLPAEPFDLYIFDGVLPDELPDGDILLIDPPAPGNELFTVGANYTPHLLSNIVVSDHPITRFVDWDNVQFQSIRSVNPTPAYELEFDVVARLDERPLLLAGEPGGRRVAVLTFDVRKSDLPLQVAFPILFANLVDWLTRATVISTDADIVRPGDIVRIQPDVSADAIAIRTPNGFTIAAPVTTTGVVFGETEQLGLYSVATGSVGTGSAVALFAVNLFSPAESDITPRETISIGRSPVGAAAADEVGQREFWPWLAALALTLLLGEWWLFHRSSTLPAAAGWRGFWRRRSTT